MVFVVRCSLVVGPRVGACCLLYGVRCLTFVACWFASCGLVCVLIVACGCVLSLVCCVVICLLFDRLFVGC